MDRQLDTYRPIHSHAELKVILNRHDLPMIAQEQTVYQLTLQADSLRAQGRYAESEVLFRSALDLTEHNFAGDDRVLLPLLNNFAVLYKYSGRFDEAECMYRRALRIAENLFGETLSSF